MNIEYRIIIGISAMVLLFASFLVAFISSQRRKLEYHKKLHAINEEQQQRLAEQNMQLEKSVQERTLELSEQKAELQQSLVTLKAAQLQLVQKEKMASLGEMAAGIAHEIQNPLNFVNNFSEVSQELAGELEKELAQGNQEEAHFLSNSLKENLSKITFHGKRAESIVKGMLQHSRAILEEKESVNINDLVDEYLRLTYHSIRVKYKGFNVELITELDNDVGSIDVYPQDLGRVLVNIYTNAFHSMYAKKILLKEAYEPTLVVRTKKDIDKVEIHIKDNGMGIPEKIISKIYQPFFTTKPPGEGTGLGLSISYDIITKAHGGELRVMSIDGEGAEFTIQLPL